MLIGASTDLAQKFGRYGNRSASGRFGRMGEGRGAVVDADVPDIGS
jgi:hypothetical protein